VKNETTTKLFDYGFTHFISGVLIPKDTTVRTITVNDIDVDLVSKMDISYTYPIGQSFIKSITFKPNEKLTLPMNTDTIAGVLHYVLEDDSTIDINLYPSKEIVGPQDPLTKIKAIFAENKDLVILVLILSAIEIFLAIYHLSRFVIRAVKK
jgi:D-alanyl-D-alanine carboxypeptidase/D-alanyl-D-alanine carboxypeptidase (penicillin-binding protein 5/6)